MRAWLWDRRPLPTWTDDGPIVINHVWCVQWTRKTRVWEFDLASKYADTLWVNWPDVGYPSLALGASRETMHLRPGVSSQGITSVTLPVPNDVRLWGVMSHVSRYTLEVAAWARD